MVDLYVQNTLLIILTFILDSSQIVLGGVVRGIGEQGDSSIISFISYGLITLPFTVLHIYWLNMKLEGILLAYIFGIAFSTICNIVLILRSDWELSVENEEPWL